MTTYKVTDFDFVFLSYDEPNAEYLYAELQNVIPWSKRVSGVKGFDSAHRACADISDTHFFVTVDGDNIVYPEFLHQEIEIHDGQENDAWTWAGRNHVNGLVYGNGGLKLWSKPFVYNMNSHENADNPAQAVDFCWSNQYHDIQGCFSESVINGSPQQAWRSGFREGVKMSLDRGLRVTPKGFHTDLWYGNINRLRIWATIGQDVENGIWAIYGARMGCHLAVLTDNEYQIISDYSAMQDLWNSVSNKNPFDESLELGNILKTELKFEIAEFSSENSKFFKMVYMNPPRPIMSWDQIQHFMASKYV